MILVPTHPAVHIVFDALAWAAGLGFGALLSRWRLKAQTARLKQTLGDGYLMALFGGAVIGGWATGSLVSLFGPVPTLSHSIAGVLCGGVIGVELYKLIKGIKGSTGGAFTGPLALGIVVGRWGCLFTGLADGTFGVATKLPWGVDLGDHVARHPVQIYESLSLLAFVGVYAFGLYRRAPWAMQRSFYAFCLWYGAQRFAWEFLKPYPKLLGPFNLFHILCAGLVLYGSYNLFAAGRTAQDRALPVS